ncbi:MAG: hypothetical protein ACLP0J_19550 [Solirubrobacteraceae bacterium]
MTDPEYFFDDTDLSDYLLFGIRYLIVPAGYHDDAGAAHPHGGVKEAGGELGAGAEHGAGRPRRGHPLRHEAAIAISVRFP